RGPGGRRRHRGGGGADDPQRHGRSPGTGTLPGTTRPGVSGDGAVSESTLPYHEHLEEIGTELAERGSQGLLVLDASSLSVIEEEDGSEPFEEVRQRLFAILREQKGKDYRNDDLLALDRPRGLRPLLFLGRKRRKSVAMTPSD